MSGKSDRKARREGIPGCRSPRCLNADPAGERGLCRVRVYLYGPRLRRGAARDCDYLRAVPRESTYRRGPRCVTAGAFMQPDW
ncbi:hypothetical protein GCM10009624_26070 [Gordonia sinesedis]